MKFFQYSTTSSLKKPQIILIVLSLLIPAEVICNCFLKATPSISRTKQYNGPEYCHLTVYLILTVHVRYRFA